MKDSKLPVYGAIAANVAIAITKFIVAGITGSSAMLSEGVHSTVDTGNGVLLLIGMKLSKRPASIEHPFGHGKELYFWSLIVAVLIFGLGGGISFYEGVVHVQNPAPLEDASWSYVVLGAAALFEGVSFVIALRHFRSGIGTRPFWRSLQASKDPSIFTVIAEDGAALLGLAIAAAGVYASHALELPVLDGVASMLIGVLLAGVAVLLIRESRGLLIGEGVHPDTTRDIVRMVSAHDAVRGVATPLTMYIGSDEVLLTLDVEFDRETPAAEIAATIGNVEHEIRDRYPMIRRIYIEARESLAADRRQVHASATARTPG